MLARLGFTNVAFWDDLPNKVRSADQDELRGHVFANGVDANGRLIAFVYAGEATRPDGSAVFVDEALVDVSVNAALLERGPRVSGVLRDTAGGPAHHMAAAARAAHTEALLRGRGPAPPATPMAWPRWPTSPPSNNS